MITIYNKQHFARLFAKAMQGMITQGYYGLGVHGCTYLTKRGSRCIVGQLLSKPDPELPALCRLTRPESANLEDSKQFRVMLARDCECDIDGQMLMLLEALQAFHDNAGRKEKRLLGLLKGDVPFTLEGFKAHSAALANHSCTEEFSTACEHVRNLIKEYAA